MNKEKREEIELKDKILQDRYEKKILRTQKMFEYLNNISII